MSETLLEITEDDIKNGIPANTCKCMIALAASRYFGIPIWISEFGTIFDALDATEDGPDEHTKCIGGLSADLFSLMIAFDGGGKVQPGKYPIYLDNGE